MEENDNIPQMTPSFENLRRKDENGNDYWSSRDLCGAMGYSAYWKFQRVIDKAIKVAVEKGMNVDEHFNQAVDMGKDRKRLIPQSDHLSFVSYGRDDYSGKCR